MWLPGVKVSILGNDAFNRKLAEIQGAQNNAIESLLQQQFDFKKGDWWIDNGYFYGRLCDMVGDRWDTSDDVDIYNSDGYIFTCQKGNVHGFFKVIGLYYDARSGESWFEREERRAAPKLGNEGEAGYNGSAILLRNDNNNEESNSNGAGNENTAEGISGLDVKGTPESTAKARRGTSENVFYSADGKLIAHRLTAEEAKQKNDTIRRQIAEAANAISFQRAYTGSGARWAAVPGNPLGKFDANFIGTGEGAQAYGWGFYGLV